MSSPALAESGVPDVPIPAVPDPVEATIALIDDAVLTTEVDLASEVIPLPAPLPAVPAPTTAAEPVAEGAGAAAPPPEPVVERPVEPALEEVAGTVAPDPPVVPDAPNPVVDQTGASNVNVSVRVDSPGDNGSVTQVNVAADGSQYQPDAPQYQAPGAGQVAETTAPPVDPAAPAGSWNWTWDCADTPEILIDPAVSSQNWTWNWNWNCGDAETIARNSEVELGSQYQPSVPQYRPVNINISIRINSPGNDGPVVQTNVAVVVRTPAPLQLPVASPGPAADVAQNLLAVAGTFALAPGLLDLAPFAAVDQAEEASEADDCCPLPVPMGTPAAAPEPQSMLLRRTENAEQREITRTAQLRASLAVTVRLAKASAAADRAARSSRKPVRTARPAPRRVPFDLTREPVFALGGAGLAPLGAADGRFGFIILVLLAIGFAFAAASRTVATEVRAAAVETGPPPDRPG